MPDIPKTPNWSGSGKMRGGHGGVRFFVAMVRLLGPRLAVALAVPPAIYFTFCSPDVPATMDFHRRMLGPQPWWKRRWLVFRHFLSFGRAMIERIAILSGRTSGFSFTFDGEENVRAAAAEGRGVLLLTAHVGNWEVAGHLLARLDVPINVTGFDHELPAVRALFNRSSLQKFRLIPLTGSPTDAISLIAALRRGEVVAIMGDRAYGGPAARVPFLGGQAPFPVGAYALAAIAESPLVQVFSLREPGGHYHFFGLPPLRLKLPPSRERDAFWRTCAAQFASQLEAIVRRDPFQWYNFFPYWDQPASAPSNATATDQPVGVSANPTAGFR